MRDAGRHRGTVDALLFEHRRAAAAVEEETEGRERLRLLRQTITEARTIVQSIAQTIQQRLHRQVARVTTRCLNAVFDAPYEFRIEFDRRRGKTEARLTFVRDGLRLDDPLNEVGGGVIDVAALALRLSAVLLSRPRRRRLLVLDEPLKNVRGVDNRERVRRMLLGLAEELGVQIFLNIDVDAYPEFALGKVVEIT